jgi:hypothetical protein
VGDEGVAARAMMEPNADNGGQAMHISERWEYLKVTAIPAEKVDSVRDAYALVGYEETERIPGSEGFDLTVRKQLSVSQQLSID